jgi:antitoxin (DNA-binding transcriptional repressor) of toxin-antitoxin stability system
MATATIEEARDKLVDLIHTLQPDEELVITENNRPVARLTPVLQPALHTPRQPGTLRGTVKYMASDLQENVLACAIKEEGQPKDRVR